MEQQLFISITEDVDIDLAAIAKTYIHAIEDGKKGDELSEFFDNNVVQIEYPNRLSVKGVKRDFTAILESAEKVKKIIDKQQFFIRNAYTMGKTVIMEIDWAGRLAVALGHMKKGETLNAHFAMVLEYSNGKIVRQRSYNCFEAF